MARCSAVRDSLSVYFVVFLTLSAVSASQDNFYNVDNAQSNEFVTFEFVGHHVHRRQASDIVPVENKYPPSTTTPPKTTTSQFPTYVRLGNKTLEENNTEMSVAQLPEKGAKSTTPAPAPATTASVPVQTAFEKLNMSTPVADEDSISISKFSDSTVNFNDTLKQHNITVTQVDNHIYYNSSFKTDADTGRYFWVNMTHKNDVKISELLSKSHRRAATVRLSFDFPFYGHIIRNVTIATGGFLYTGDYVHSWLAATQYIAPLMANFDTSLSEDSYIKYYDNGTAFTVLWENVSLQDRPTEGKFTFQATLHSTGDIVFVYQNVPVIIEKIQDNLHPVKVGLSDAYIIDRTIYFVRRKTIYEYHRVNFRKEDIKNWTVIYLTALPTCPGIKDCQSCLTNELANFKCTWCPSINKCSNGLDRSRQEWLTKGCDKRQIKHESECSQIFGPDPFDDHDLTYSHEPNFDHIAEDPMRASSRISHDSTVVPAPPVKMGVSTIVAILFIVALVGALGIWIMYAYRNPHTTSGQMLIRYRPSQWSWRRGEARYTAATIHM